MNQIRKTGNLLSFAGLVFLFFLFFFEDRLQLPAWIQVIGRMHPLLLHFPIVLLLISAISYWLPEQTGWEKPWELIRLSAALTAIATAIMGMFLSIQEDGKGDILAYHKWGGLVIATLAWVLYQYHAKIARHLQLARTASVVTVAGILITGHWGADLTHGENFLLAPMQPVNNIVIQEADARIFPDVIHLVLQTKCGSCHQNHNQKGGLSLTDSVSVIKGGKNGSAVVPGQPEKSLVLTRIHLPLSDKKHMPLSDKPQLTEEEVNLLETWIRAGAPFSQKLTDRPVTDSLRILAHDFIEPYLQKTRDEHFDFAAAGTGTIKKLNNNYRVIRELGKNSPALAVSFYGKAQYSFDALKELDPIKKQILHLNVSKMPVTDAQLDWISRLPNLRRLNLNYTGVTDAGIPKLSGMKNLEMVSVAGTGVSGKGLTALLNNPSIKELYVWDSKVKPEEAAAAHKQFPLLTIDPGFEGADTMLIALNKPIIKTGSAVFYDSILVELSHPIRGVELRYSTDGKEPDSLGSPVYTNPVILRSNTQLQVKAYKKGWLSSEIVKGQYLKSLPVVQTKLLTPADEKYGAHAEKILTDHDLGDPSDFGTRWLGYRKNEALFVFDLGTPQQVKEVSVTNLVNLSPYLFPPTSLTVWGSRDEKNWELLKTLSPTIPAKLVPLENSVLRLSFAPVNIRYLKLKAVPIKHLPNWHPAKGQPGWFFISEVMVN